MESDSDLIEACIYEMEALRARYRYLLKAAREQGITAAPDVYKRQVPKRVSCSTGRGIRWRFIRGFPARRRG